VSLHFIYHSPGVVPATCLILEVVVPDDWLLGWPPHRPLQQMPDLLLQDITKPDTQVDSVSELAAKKPDLWYTEIQ